MQNNITELTQRLLRALDSNYNVNDMATVLDVITLLERVSITKELLETTRLGKHINDLRRNTSNESLAKRIKELLKKWRSKIMSAPAVEANGQIRQTLPEKRPAKDRLDTNNIKRPRVNGVTEYDFSDNSNSSFKDAAAPKSVILINSDSNSSLPDVKHEPVLEEQQPKKRGRKKGSRNHRSLLDEAESSFTNKMAVSRGNAKVKTTQELIASLQSRNSVAPVVPTTPPAKNIEDWNERAAKLTERVSFIDSKLNASANRPKKKKQQEGGRNRTIVESGSVTNYKTEPSRPESPDDEEIVVVDDEKENEDEKPIAPTIDEPIGALNSVPSLSVEEALSRLPPIDASFLHDPLLDEPPCVCTLTEEDDQLVFAENPDCPANYHLRCRHRLEQVTDERIDQLHSRCLDGVNGSFGAEEPPPREPHPDIIVPNFYELSPKRVDRDSVCENFKKYSISDGGTLPRFREYHEVLDRPSYNGDVLRILPYVVID